MDFDLRTRVDDKSSWVRALTGFTLVAAVASIVPCLADVIRYRPLLSGDLYAAYLPPVLRLLDGNGAPSWENLFHGTGRVPGYPFVLYVLHHLLGSHLELINAPTAINVAGIVTLAASVFFLGRSVGQRTGAPNLAGALSVFALTSTRSFIDAVYNATPDILFAVLVVLFAMTLIRAMHGHPAMFLMSGVIYGLLSLVRMNGFTLALAGVAVALATTSMRLGRRLAWLLGSAATALLTLSLWTPVSWRMKQQWFWIEYTDSADGLHPDLVSPGQNLALDTLLQKYPVEGLIRVVKRGLWTGPIEVLTKAFSTWTIVLIAVTVAVLVIGALRRPRVPPPFDGAAAVVLLFSSFALWLLIAPIHYEARYYLPIFLLLTPLLVAALLRVCAWLYEVSPTVPAGLLLVHLAGTYHFFPDHEQNRQDLEWNQDIYRRYEAFVATTRKKVDAQYATATTSWGSFFFTAAQYLLRREHFRMNGWEPTPPERHAIYFDLPQDDLSSRVDPTASLDRLWPLLLDTVPEFEATRTPEEARAFGPIRRAAFLMNPAILLPEIVAPKELGDGSMLTSADGESFRATLRAPGLVNRILAAPDWRSTIPRISAVLLDGAPVKWTAEIAGEKPGPSPVVVSFEARFATEIEVRFAEQARLSELRGLYWPGPAAKLDQTPQLERLMTITSTTGAATIEIPAEGAYIFRAPFIDPSGAAQFRQLRLETPRGSRPFSIPDDSAIGVAAGFLSPGRHRLSASGFAGDHELFLSISSVDVFRVKAPPVRQGRE